MNFELGKEYIVEVSEEGIIPIEEFDSDRFYDKDHDDLDFLTDEEKIIVINDVLDAIKAEIEQKIEQERFARSVFRHEEKEAVKAEQCTGSIVAYYNVIRFIEQVQGRKRGRRERMSVVIKGFDKPVSCLSCPFNHSDCWCAITEGGIDRDDYSCDLPCPIMPLDTVLDEIRAEIIEEKDYAYADFEQYKVDYLGVDAEYADDELPQDDFRYGMERAIEIINKYRAESEKV